MQPIKIWIHFFFFYEFYKLELFKFFRNLQKTGLKFLFQNNWLISFCFTTIRCKLFSHSTKFDFTSDKRYFKIDQHLAQHFIYYVSPFLCSQKLPLFVIQWSPPIRKMGWNFSQLWNTYSCSSVEFLQIVKCRECVGAEIVVVRKCDIWNEESEGKIYFLPGRICSYAGTNLNTGTIFFFFL